MQSCGVKVRKNKYEENVRLHFNESTAKRGKHFLIKKEKKYYNDATRCRLNTGPSIIKRFLICNFYKFKY